MTKRLGLFEGFGVEVEYAIVRREGLAVSPVCDRLFDLAGAAGESDVERGAMEWSNELALHVVEVKTNGPAAALAPLADLFQGEIRVLNTLLERLDARLLPTGMHPFMDPLTETRLWTSGSSEIYAAYDRIFDCRGHGWSNLQSMHLNLPFRGEAEFGRLQAALRLVLPILPALAASSPIADGRPQGARDFRIVSYKKNQALIPIITGRVVPEQYFTERDYERVVKEPIARAVAPHDPDGVLRGPWLDSRGLLPRFDRGSIEIRLLDTQECPRADLAVIALVVAVTRALVEERWSTLAEQQAWDVDSLARLLDACVVSAEETVIEDERFWGVFGLAKPDAPRAGVLWNTLYESVHSAELKPFTREIEAILSNGTLASRIVRATGHNPDRHSIEHVYRRLADCLDHGRMFIDAV